MTEEENEKLKIQLKVAGERIDTLSSTNIALSNQIEYYKKGVAEILNSDDSEIGELRKLLGIVYVDENELNQLRELKNQIEKNEKLRKL